MSAVPQFVFEMVAEHILGCGDLREQLAGEAASHGDLDQARDLRAFSREAATLAAEGVVEMAREGHDRAVAIMREVWEDEERGAIALTSEQLDRWASGADPMLTWEQVQEVLDQLGVDKTAFWAHVGGGDRVPVPALELHRLIQEVAS